MNDYLIKKTLRQCRYDIEQAYASNRHIHRLRRFFREDWESVEVQIRRAYSKHTDPIRHGIVCLSMELDRPLIGTHYMQTNPFWARLHNHLKAAYRYDWYDASFQSKVDESIHVQPAYGRVEYG